MWCILTCLHLWNHHHFQDIEHFFYSPPHPQFSSVLLQFVLSSATGYWFHFISILQVSYLPANPHAHEKFESSGKLGWHSVIRATFTPINFPLCWRSTTKARHLPQHEEERGLPCLDPSLRIGGSPSSHSAQIPASEPTTVLSHGMFSLLLSGAKQVFMLVEPLATCPDSQNAVEPICITSGFRAVIPKR